MVITTLCDSNKFAAQTRDTTQNLFQRSVLINSPSLAFSGFFSPHFFVSPHGDTHSPDCPSRAPGLASMLTLWNSCVPPYRFAFIFLFKVRSWNLTQWGMEGQNQSNTYRDGLKGSMQRYPLGIPWDEERSLSIFKNTYYFYFISGRMW